MHPLEHLCPPVPTACCTAAANGLTASTHRIRKPGGPSREVGGCRRSEEETSSGFRFWGPMASPWKDELLLKSLQQGLSLRGHALEPTHRFLLRALVGFIFIFSLSQNFLKMRDSTKHFALPASHEMPGDLVAPGLHFVVATADITEYQLSVDDG